MDELLSRERVELALSHKNTDRVPTDFWAVEEVIKNLSIHFNHASEEEILQYLNVDLRFVWPDYIGPANLVLPDGSYIDYMGHHHRIVSNDFCTYEEYAGFPLAYVQTLDDLTRYDKWPDANWWNWDTFSEKIGDLHDKYYIKLHAGGIFEQAWGLRGNEEFFVDMGTNPEIPHYIMNKICDFYCCFIKKAMEAAGDKIDMVYTYDDIASQNSLLMSPGMWAEFIKPYHEKVNKVIKNYGKKIMYHSCGAIRPLIGELQKLHIDVLNPLQPLAKGMDLTEIKNTYGNKLCFHGAIDIQELLPKGPPGRIKKEAQRVVNILGKDGGFILASAHYIQADTPVENILALYDLKCRVPINL
ncbi:MAG: uroporphyrinogen decarboxylase family protein [Bacillota bacterium]|nr:uroporphyrinogen decarboxylase family protein [Bacillota bacterium]NLV63218.1 hypothetical protein [Clostridiaceae bacterium]